MFFMSNVQAQFTKKMELNLSGGIWSVASKQIDIPQVGAYEFGDMLQPIGRLNLWYNLSREYSLGLNFGGAGFAEGVIYSNSDPLELEYEYYNLYLGVGFKYNFLVRKKIAFYARISANLNFHSIETIQYLLVNSSSNSDTPSAFFLGEGYSDYNIYLKPGIEFATGLKVYFTKSVGTILDAGYSANGYFNGPMATLGFFFDF
jgi:hypothetical protein